MDIQGQITLLIECTMFIMVIVMNIVKRNTTAVYAYSIQSLAIVALLTIQALQEHAPELFFVVMVLLVVKAVVAPKLFIDIVRKSKLNIETSTNLNVPMTLGTLVLLSAFATSHIFNPIHLILPIQPGLQLFLVGGILMSCFLTMNRKGVLSQLIGILSLENFIFAMSRLLGIHELLFLEVALLFDVLFWIIVASTFVHMIYRHYGSFASTQMQALKK